MAKKIPLFIEFAGLPGVGKTTISNEVINQLKISGFNIPNLSILDSLYKKEIIIDSRSSHVLVSAKKWIMSIVGDIKRSILIFKISSTFRYKGISLLKASQGMLNGIGFYRLLKNSDYEIVILDEGFLHKIFSLMVFQNKWNIQMTEHSIIQKIIDFYKENNIFLCYLHVSPEVCMDRLINRGIQTIELSDENIVNELTKNGPSFTAFLEDFKTRYSYFIDINTGENISKNVDVICDKIVLLCKKNINK